MNGNDIITLLGADWTGCEDLIRSSLRSDIGLLNSINDSTLSNSGKQLRPKMALLTARCLGGANSDSLRYAAAVELLHNATLFHDDVADSSAMRRGRPTLAALMGPNAAVLVGDYWLARAVDLIIGTTHRTDAFRMFSATLSHLAEGEMLQLEKASEADTTEEDYLRIIHCKTASLFETACVTAALSVDAPGHLCDAASRFGRATGLAFQIRDDIFDYLDDERIGKPVGIDLKEQKITLPLLGALKNAPDEAALRAKVLAIPEHPEYVAELRSYVCANGGIEYATQRLDDFIAEALDALEAFPPSPERDALAEIARYNAIRKI
ncbi:MAG: polyprenyl synthetase family protein [Bacteroidales bacterium]|nr:polyprenyl synthetase family protein [Bacteroidales bacterium]